MKKITQDTAYAIVDVETTGARPLYDRVLEIAIIRIENGNVVSTYSTVIDPEAYVPPTILSLTGITEKEIGRAPTFATVAHEIKDMLSDAVFVAHNARFDYAFVKRELARAGIVFSATCLCTVKLSRHFFPAHKKHDLSSIIERFNFRCDARHRALADAEVVRDFLSHCNLNFGEEKCLEAYRTVMKRNALPVHISHDEIDALPESAGVYIFYGEGGDVLYIGKSIHIRDRVLSHFSGDHRSSKEMRLAQETHDIEAIETPGELSALLLESSLIKMRQPLYNRLSRHSRELIVVVEKTNSAGYLQVETSTLKESFDMPTKNVVGVFRSRSQAKRVLDAYAKEYSLCHVLLGLETSNRGCFLHHLGVCKGACVGKENPVAYNLRHEQAFKARRVKAWPFSGPVKIEERNEKGEGVVFVVDEWRLIKSIKYDEGGEQDFLNSSQKFDYDMYKILAKHLT